MELQKRLDKVFACKNLFYCSENERKEIKEYLIPAAFEYHFENCSLYKNYCEKIGIDPSKIKKIEDISKIPLLPSSIFKNQTVISGNKTDIVKKCTSSGTKGTVSCVYRDMNTIKNFFQSSKKNIVDLLNVENGECINLTPVSDAPEVKHLWLPYAMEYVEKFFPTVYCVEKGVLNVEKVYQNLDRMLKDNKTAILRLFSFFTQLKYLNVFKKIKGMIIGAENPGNTRININNYIEILKELCIKIDFPIIANTNFSHYDPIYSLIIGGRTELNSEINNTYIKIKESIF